MRVWPWQAAGPDTKDAPEREYITERAMCAASLDQGVGKSGSPQGRILEVGCGIGLVTRHLIGRRSKVWALDASRSSLMVLQGALGGRPDLEIVHGEVQQLPFADNFFDAVLSPGTLNHLTPDAQRGAVAELMRVLKPQGKYAMSVHHYSRHAAANAVTKEGARPGRRYFFRFTRAELQALLPEARIRAVGFYGWPMQQILSRVAGHTLARLGRGDMLIAIGQKRAPPRSPGKAGHSHAETSATPGIVGSGKQ